MSATNDGGPAFPGSLGADGRGNTRPIYSPDGGREWEQLSTGMSLRDYFAAKALAGICAQGDYGKHPSHKDESWAVSMAAHAYDYADAMLAARAK